MFKRECVASIVTILREIIVSKRPFITRVVVLDISIKVGKVLLQRFVRLPREKRICVFCRVSLKRKRLFLLSSGLTELTYIKIQFGNGFCLSLFGKNTKKGALSSSIVHTRPKPVGNFENFKPTKSLGALKAL